MDRNLVGSDDWKYIKGIRTTCPQDNSLSGHRAHSSGQVGPAEDKLPVKIIPPSTLYYFNDRQIIIILLSNRHNVFGKFLVNDDYRFLGE